MFTKRFISFILAITALLMFAYAVIAAPAYIAMSGLVFGAVLSQGILGPIKNKVGGVVAASWKGINYVRGYVTPSNPNTTAQQTQRTLFAQIVAAAVLIKSTVIQPFWDVFYSSMSGFNAFMQYNLLNMTAPFSYANMLVAKGSLEPETVAFTSYAGGNVTLGWTPAGLGNGLDTDSAYGVIFDAANNIAFVSDGSDTRVDGTLVMAIGAGRDVAQLHNYLFFSRGASSTLEVSNSTYVVGA